MSKWIEELSIERSTQYSNGIIVQTDDCKRISEFFIVMKKQHPKPIIMRIKNKQTGIWIRENYYILDGWEGLCQFKKNNGSWSLVNIADAKKYGGEFRPLLTAVGKELEKGNAVVVIQNMLTSDKFINNALRSWSTSDILRNKNSTVIVFTEDMNMFPENVWSKMKIIDVPKSETEERREIISSQQMAMGLPQSVLLKDEELKSAVRVTAGMNLDQVDASVVESLIRHNRIKIGSLANSKNEMLGKNPGLDIIQRPDFGFEAIGGYDTLKERIRSDVILPLQHPDVAKKYDMSPPRGMILFGPPGCFVEGTFVTMADGSLKRIEYFGKYHLQEINEKIKTTSEMGKDDAVQFHIYDNCPCYEIITESGRKVECSYNQQFWTIDEEWKQADQLNVGEKIRVAVEYKNTIKEYIKIRPKNLYSKEKTRREMTKEYVLDEDLALLFGYSFGDGNIHFRNNPRKPYEINIVINEEEQDIIPKIKKTCEDKFGIEPRTRIKKPKDGEYRGRKIKRKQEMTYLEISSLEIGSLFYFLHEKKKQRTPPKEILQSPKSVVSQFLKGYFEADGCCRGKGKGQSMHNSVCLKSSNPKTLEITQLLLLQYNIKARIYKNNLSIQRAEDIRKFAKEIGFASDKKKTKLKNLLELLPTERTNKASKFEKIKSVKKTGNRTVYDITTKTQEFIANGIKVHNTGKTVMTKAMSRELNMSVLVLRPENFMSKYVGESEKGLKNVFKIADSMAPCILFLDEVDRLSKRASAGGSDGGAQVHREIFSMMLEKLGDERRKWFFVGCTNRLEDIDEAMRRTGRIDTLAPVPYPDEKAKERIFQIHSTVKRKLPLAEKINFKELASNRYTYMWSGSDIEELVRRTAKEVMKQSITDGKVRNIKMDDFYKMIDTFNVDSTANETLQEHIKEQAKKLTNDKRLMDVFDEAQVVDEGGRGEKAKEVMTSRALENYIDFDEDED